MSKTLVAFFSASQVTKKVAENLAVCLEADCFEIIPEALYTAQDLDWRNKESRSSTEMQDLSCRPAVVSKVENMDEYDTVYVGFPIWWGREPSVVDTFIDAYDFTGKVIVPFCTSGGSGVEGSVKRIKELVNADVKDGIRIAAGASVEDIKACI